MFTNTLLHLVQEIIISAGVRSLYFRQKVLGISKTSAKHVTETTKKIKPKHGVVSKVHSHYNIQVQQQNSRNKS
jgi:hypothetical protein